jgi:hypothetical protein
MAPYGGKVVYCTCHIFETSSVTPTVFCFYYEHIINFTPGKFKQIVISRTIVDESEFESELSCRQTTRHKDVILDFKSAQFDRSKCEDFKSSPVRIG